MSIFDSFVTSVKNASFNTVSNTFKSMTNRLQLVVYEEQEFNREASCTTLKLDFQSEYSLVELDRNDSNVLSVTYQAKVIDKNDSKVSVSFSHEADSLSLTFKDCMEEHNNPATYFNLKDPSYQYVPLMFKVIIKIPKLSKFNLIINSKLCIFNHNQIPLKSLVFITSSLQLSDFGTDSNRLELISKKGNIELNNVKTKNIQAMSVLGAVHVSHTECNHIVLSANNGMDLHESMFSSAVIATTAGLLTISGVDSKSLNISGNEGDISLSRVNAVDLNCSTITGVIELENVQSVNTKLLSKTGTLRMINLNTIKLKILSSEDSAIMIKDGAYHELNAVSVHGSIHLSNVDAKKVELLSEHGSIDMINSKIEKLMSIQTNHGDISVKGKFETIDSINIQVNPICEGKVKLRSITGQIIAIIDNYKEFDASSNSGNISVITTHLKGQKTIAKTNHGDISIDTIAFRGRISMKTINGSVQAKRVWGKQLYKSLQHQIFIIPENSQSDESLIETFSKEGRTFVTTLK